MCELLLLLTLCSGGVLGAACLHKRFEEMLPITCGSISLTVFLFGLAGLLPLGPIVVMLAVLGVYGCLIFRLIRRKNLAEFRANLLTPGFVGFFLLFWLLCFLNRGQLLYGSDPYGHWGLAVKEMLLLGDFSTNPRSADAFAGYPPIMPVFQYFLQRILFLFGRTEISEWHLYLSWQLFSLSFLLPTMKYARWKRPISAVFGFAAICLAPMVVFSYFYNTVLIDSFLGVVFAYGIVMVFTEGPENKSNLLGIGISMAVLALAKDSGLSFAVIILLALVCTLRDKQNGFKTVWKPLLFAAAFLLIPKLLWSLHTALRHSVTVHSSTAGFTDYVRFFTLRDTSGFRYRTAALFLRILYGTAYHFNLFNREIPYIYILLALILLAQILRPVLLKAGILREREGSLFCPVLAIHILVYTIGLCYVYLFRMPYHDAVGLDSMDRYLDTVVLSVWLVLCLLTIRVFFQSEGQQKSFLTFLLAVSMLLLVPQDAVIRFAARQNIRINQAERVPYDSLAETAREHIQDPAARIMVADRIIDRTDDHRCMAYLLRPLYISNYVLSERNSDYFLFKDMNCQAFTDLMRQEFDYVLTCRLDDYFLENYSDAFANPQDIHDFSVYGVDPQTGLLSLITCTE